MSEKKLSKQCRKLCMAVIQNGCPYHDTVKKITTCTFCCVISMAGDTIKTEKQTETITLKALDELLDICIALADRLRVHSEGKIMLLEPVQQRGWATLLEKAICKAKGE